MQTQYTLIMLPNNPIIISNEKLSIKDECYHLEGFTTIEDDLDKEIIYKNGGRKIVAGVKDLPQINFSKLTKQEKEKIGWVDVISELGKIFKEYSKISLEKKEPFWTGKCAGIAEALQVVKAHQFITNKMFSYDDLIKAMEWGMNLGEHSTFYTDKNVNDLLDSLQQPIQLNVEVEMEKINLINEKWVSSFEASFFPHLVEETINQPKITNNSILITKIL